MTIGVTGDYPVGVGAILNVANPADPSMDYGASGLPSSPSQTSLGSATLQYASEDEFAAPVRIDGINTALYGGVAGSLTLSGLGADGLATYGYRASLTHGSALTVSAPQAASDGEAGINPIFHAHAASAFNGTSAPAAGADADAFKIGSGATASTAADSQLGHTDTSPTGQLPYPYDGVCLITDVINGVAYRASGVIVGPHTILTAAHVVWDADSGQSATQIEIYPGYSASYHVALPGAAIHYNPVNDAGGLISQSQAQHDFAIIDVAQNLDAYGLFQIDPNYGGGQGNISGYPGANGYDQQDASGLLTADSSYHLIDYSAAAFNVSPGSSGGPIWIDQGTGSNASPAVVGLVSTDDWGPQITSADLAQIEGWVAQDTPLFNDTPGDITGSTFNDHLIGDAGANLINGQGGNDILTGGLGADTFVFQPGAGTDAITDFSPAQGDKIDLSAFGTFSNFTNVLAAASQVGANVVITLGSGSLTLDNVQLTSLTGSDFGFVGLLANSLTTPIYSGLSRAYGVAEASGVTEVTGGPENATDTWNNVQKITFVDGYLAVGTADPAAQVFRLYEAALGRAPDPEGLAGWVHSLAAGTGLQAVADGFVGSQEFNTRYGNPDNTSFVTLLYHNVLGRAPDAGGLADWTADLAAGQTRSQVVLGFSESPEFVAQTAPVVEQGVWVQDTAAAEVARLYDTVLGRLPDAGGEIGWTNALHTGTTLLQVTQGFVGSAEFQSVYGSLDDSHFVELLYNNALHRDAEPTGLAGWVSYLNAGHSRAEVVDGFSESAEHIADTAPHIDNGVWFL